MENTCGSLMANGCKYGVPVADVGGQVHQSRIRRWTMEEGVEQNDLRDRFRSSGGSGKFTTLQKLLGELGAEESASSGDDDFHAGWWCRGYPKSIDLRCYAVGKMDNTYQGYKFGFLGHHNGWSEATDEDGFYGRRWEPSYLAY